MAQSRKCAALAAGSAAVVLLGAPAFTAGPSAAVESHGAPRNYAQIAQAPSQSSTGSAAGLTLGTVGIVGVAGVAASRAKRVARVARAGVLTTDDQGRFRFDAPETPLVPSEQPGAVAPLGFFDPLGFSKSGLMTFPGDSTGFKHLRAAEIKQGTQPLPSLHCNLS